MSISKKVMAETTKQVKAASAKAGKESVNDKFAAYAVMEGKPARVKSELAKAYDRAEEAANTMFLNDCMEEVKTMISTRIEIALIQQRDLLTKKGLNSEARVLDSIITRGKEETNGFRIKFSDTENGLTETEASDVHTMFAAAKQSLLKVKIAEREEKAAAEAAEEERKLAVMEEVGITPEQLAALRAAGVIK